MRTPAQNLASGRTLVYPTQQRVCGIWETLETILHLHETVGDPQPSGAGLMRRVAEELPRTLWAAARHPMGSPAALARSDLASQLVLSHPGRGVGLPGSAWSGVSGWHLVGARLGQFAALAHPTPLSCLQVRKSAVFAAWRAGRRLGTSASAACAPAAPLPRFAAASRCSLAIDA